ncbi:MAG: DUF3082 domain-containing protein [Oculatellaceae cyanobacterium Prado106]|jgi:hypothetical protein|nr:DUF3082 domain-containing protein [Oculatellaceae cyanobacterium Prado106]
MADSTPEQTSLPDSKPTSTSSTAATPLRCLIGAAISGALGLALYALTQSIAQSFASKPLPTVNITATNIAIAVRTLVVGCSTLATAIFTITAVGLILLAIQLLVQQMQNASGSK